MKSILCYGDSLTYGANPIPNSERHPFESRWPGALQSGLGSAAIVIAEGLGGRTTVHDDWYADADRNGARVLPTLLSSHSPLDMVIIMLGTNDLKHFLGATAVEASFGMRRLIRIVRGHAAGEGQPEPKIIIVAPPPMCDTDHADMMLHFGGNQAIAQSKELAKFYALRAEEFAVGFFDAGTVAKADPNDGVHLDAKNTAAIGTALVPIVKKALGL